MVSAKSLGCWMLKDLPSGLHEIMCSFLSASILHSILWSTIGKVAPSRAAESSFGDVAELSNEQPSACLADDSAQVCECTFSVMVLFWISFPFSRNDFVALIVRTGFLWQGMSCGNTICELYPSLITLGGATRDFRIIRRAIMFVIG